MTDRDKRACEHALRKLVGERYVRMSEIDAEHLGLPFPDDLRIEWNKLAHEMNAINKVRQILWNEL